MQRKAISSKIVLGAAGGLALSLSSGPALAQGYMPYDNGPGFNHNAETVEVYAYRDRRHSALGGDIVRVSYSAPVRSDDLDLTTASGASTFRARVTSKALQLCETADTHYPLSANDDSGPVKESSCYRNAVSRGLQDADAAIGRARSYAGRWR